MANIITNPSPKARFLDNPQAVTGHRALIEHASFQRSADAALLEYAGRLTEQQTDFQGAAANHFKLIGAKEYLATFRLLAETPVKPTYSDRDNLPSTK